jgi:hypothetical protein
MPQHSLGSRDTIGGFEGAGRGILEGHFARSSSQIIICYNSIKPIKINSYNAEHREDRHERRPVRRSEIDYTERSVRGHTQCLAIL